MSKIPRIRLVLVILVCSCFYCNSQAWSQSVDIKQMTARAQDLQSQDRNQEAAKIYVTILNSYPRHEPTLINYAKLLYRMDKTSEACVIFSKVNLNHLDTATTYEYGLAHFWQKKYATAYTAFKRIPPGDSLYDLASYYGAISAFKLKRYTEAEFMMNKAVVLPESLQESKKNYQKYISEMKNFDEQRRLKEEAQLEKRRVLNEMNERKRLQEEANTKSKLTNIENKRNVNNAPKNQQIQQQQQQQQISQENQQQIKKQDILKKKVKIRNKIPPTEFFHKAQKEAVVGYTYKNDGYNFFEYGGTTSVVHSLDFSFKNAPLFFFGKNNPSVMGIQIDIGGGYSTSKGVEYRTFAFETNRDKLRVYSSFFERQDAYYDRLERERFKNLGFKANDDTTSTTTTETATGTVQDDSVTLPSVYNQTYEEQYDDDSFIGAFGVNPWIDFPLKNLFWISLGANVFMYLRDFDFASSATDLGGYFIVGKRFFKDELARLYLKYNFSTILAGGSMEIFDNEVLLQYEQMFFKSFGVEASLKGNFYGYSYDDLPGPSSVVTTSTNLYYNFIVGLSVGGMLSFDYIMNYLLASSRTDLVQLDIETSGTSFGGKAYIKFQPTFFPWVSLEVSQSYNMYSWSTEDDTKEKIEKSIPESSDTLKAQVNINLFF